jgi:hypothetical protein
MPAATAPKATPAATSNFSSAAKAAVNPSVAPQASEQIHTFRNSSASSLNSSKQGIEIPSFLQRGKK